MTPGTPHQAAGIGLRAAARVASVLAALRGVGITAPCRVGVPEDKRTHPAVRDLADLGYQIIPVARAAMQGLTTPTQSIVARAAYGTGSVAEACALAAAGPQSVICVSRAVSADHMATAALAGPGQPFLQEVSQ